MTFYQFFFQEGEEVSDAVKVKGPGNCVDQAIAMIKEHTDDFIAQVTEEIEIEKHFHGDIIGKGGKQVQEVKNIRCYILYGWFECKIWSRVRQMDCNTRSGNYCTVGTVDEVWQSNILTFSLVAKRFQCPNQVPIKGSRREC